MDWVNEHVTSWLFSSLDMMHFTREAIKALLSCGKFTILSGQRDGRLQSTYTEKDHDNNLLSQLYLEISQEICRKDSKE
jgi:hypothetical protein